MKNNNIEAVYSLSPMQQGMYFHSELSNNSGVYIEQLNCLLVGQLDVEAFQKACQHILNRHSILRTAFAVGKNGKLFQVVGKQTKIPFEILDFSDYSETQQQQKIHELQKTEHNQGFVLSKAPLMRIKLIKLDAERHHFIWTHHHLLLDGWSVPLVLGEVFLAYEAFRSNQSVDLPPVTPYRNYIQWLESQDLNKARHYWQSVLKNGNRATELPKSNSGNETTANGNSSSGEIRLRLSEAESERIKRFAQRQKVTVNTIMQGAWAMVLSGYSGEEEVQFGATVSGRPAELEGVGAMVGLFINTLPVRIKLEMEAEVGDWLRRLQTEQTRSREYEYSPLTEIRKWTEVKAEDKLFESILVFENYPIEEVSEQKTGSLEIQSISLKEHPDLPITIVSDLREILVIRIKYDAGIFSAEEINIYLDNLKNVLFQIISDQPVKLKEINLLTAQEKKRIIEDNNDTAVEYEPLGSIVEAFSRQALLAPDARAVSFGDQTLTYRQLDERSNQLAHFLRDSGAGIEQRVGVLMPRSIELVISLLAILKTGAAYVPLDPAYPLERLRYMADDAALQLVITEGGAWRNVFGVDDSGQNREGGLRVIEWEGAGERIYSSDNSGLNIEIEPESMAYMIYTSGSTGLPKGAVNSHRAILNRLQWMQSVYQLQAGEDRILQKTPVSFDVSVWELFPAADVWSGVGRGGSGRASGSALSGRGDQAARDHDAAFCAVNAGRISRGGRG